MTRVLVATSCGIAGKDHYGTAFFKKILAVALIVA
jgi:hypothetical protein